MLGSGLLGSGALAPTEARAQPRDDSARAAARELANAGGALYHEGRYAEAFEKLDKAYAILKVPTIGYWSARCLEELGRWVEASERYLEVTRLTPPSAGTEIHLQAQGEAQKAQQALTPRIPRLLIRLGGASPSEVSLALDGRPIASAMVEVPFPADPGKREIVAQRGAERLVESATLSEGGAAEVVFTFTPREPEGRDDFAPKPSEAPLTRPPLPSTEPEGLRVASYVAFTLGGLGLATGIVAGAILLDRNAVLDGDVCVAGECSARVAEDVRVYDAMRYTTTVGLAVGGAGLAAGLSLWLVADAAEETPALVLGPSWLGLRGRF